jgi:hypothetical protein
MAEHGRYLFAVARGLEAEALSGVTGLRTAPVDVVEHRGLQAVVCDVDLADFGEEALVRNLEDLAWLEEVARGHDDVVRAVAGTVAIAPMRLVTICSTDASVRDHIEHLYDDLVAVLDRVEGRREWSVKAYAVRASQEPETTPSEEPTTGAGAAYLQRKRQEANRRRAASERSIEVADEIHAELAGHAVAGRRLQPQDPKLTGRNEPMILNGAYLVGIEDGEAFTAAVSALAARIDSVTVEVQGPWPPYSFAVLE